MPALWLVMYTVPVHWGGLRKDTTFATVRGPAELGIITRLPFATMALIANQSPSPLNECPGTRVHKAHMQKTCAYSRTHTNLQPPISGHRQYLLPGTSMIL